MKYLGIDYGTKRTGIAFSDEEGLLAYPHGVLLTSPALAKEVAALARKEEAGTIVIGDSRDFNGRENPVMKHVRKFAAVLTKEIAAPIVYEPEVFTSQEADRTPDGRDELRDARAAAIMLQSYLDRIRGFEFG